MRQTDYRIKQFVRLFFNQRKKYLKLLAENESPIYVFEPHVLRQRAKEFRRAFMRKIDHCGFYFAVKSNNHPLVAKTLIESAFGLDVSSGTEAAMALKLGARDIFFTGPGKTAQELDLALKHPRKITVLLDSFYELNTLEKIAGAKNVLLNAGVRLSTNPSGRWRKFGIALNDLARFFQEAEKCAHINLQGIQFHTSWNHTPRTQTGFIRSLGNKLKTCPSRFLTKIKFLDVGGGYWPESGEWLLSNNALPSGKITIRRRYVPACPIEYFSEELCQAINKYLGGLLPIKVCFEPGRWICHDSMHLLMTVVDKKALDLVITDLGTNAIGWERFVTNYCPILNLSRPSLSEKPCFICGPLCTPDDHFGFSYFGDDIQIGDILLIPCQGAYTYSLKQEFIKPFPKVVVLHNGKMTPGGGAS